MKAIRYMFLTLTALALVAWVAPAFAFHSGGVAECEGCHSMHEPASSPLLVGLGASSTCLSCHEQAGLLTPSSYHVSTAAADQPAGSPPTQRTPGGDFGWLRKTYTFTPRGGATPETNLGDAHGHNIVATDYGYGTDTQLAAAPGGTMPSSELGCESCHDPHGQARRIWNGTAQVIVSPLTGLGPTYPPILGSGSYHNSFNPQTATVPGYSVGVYRILGGPGYRAWDNVAFPGAPMAVVNSSYNRREYSQDGTSLGNTRVSYGTPGANVNGFTSMSRWCATCHPTYHTDVAGLKHPVDESLGGDIADNYNSYRKTGDLSGVVATSYTSLVPFAKPTTDFGVLRTYADNYATGVEETTGADAGDHINCLTCHRAHAGAWDFALRWNYQWEFMTLVDTTGVIKYPATDATGNRLDNPANLISAAGAGHRGYSNAEMLAAYYDRPANTFAGYQRAYCNKCHIKD